MKILVCISNVPDTTTKIRLLEGNNEYDKTGIQWIINPWDELALTRALELKEDASNLVNQVTVATVGLKDAEPTIRKALAIGADDAVRIDANASDAWMVATQIAGYLKTTMYDIILCGIESADYNGSMAGGMLSEMLDITSISAVSGLQIVDGGLLVNREIDGGKEVISVGTPAVLIVQKGIAKEPRIASMRGIMASKTKPVLVVAGQNTEPLTELLGYELPKPKAACRMVNPDNVKELVELLRNEAKVI